MKKYLEEAVRETVAAVALTKEMSLREDAVLPISLY